MSRLSRSEFSHILQCPLSRQLEPTAVPPVSWTDGDGASGSSPSNLTAFEGPHSQLCLCLCLSLRIKPSHLLETTVASMQATVFTTNFTSFPLHIRVG